MRHFSKNEAVPNAVLPLCILRYFESCVDTSQILHKYSAKVLARFGTAGAKPNAKKVTRAIYMGRSGERVLKRQKARTRKGQEKIQIRRNLESLRIFPIR